jgi:hypothetical protein
VDPSGAGPRLYFQRVPEGKVVKNRVHLDVRVGTGLMGEECLAALEAECGRCRQRAPSGSVSGSATAGGLMLTRPTVLV